MARVFQCLSALLALAMSATLLHGQTVFVWDGSSSTAWGTAANWNLNAVPGATGIARFNTNTSRDPTIGATATSIGRLEFLSGSDAETIGGTAVLTLGGVGGTGITNSSAVNQTISTGVAVGANQTWTTTGTGSNLTLARTLDLNGHALTLNSAAGTTIALSTGSGDLISSTLSGGSLIKTGTGDLTLGNVANTFTGGAQLNAGTTTIGNNASLGTGTVTLGGGTLNATADRTLANALTLTGASTISGDSGTDFIFTSNTVSTTGGTLHLGNTSGSGTMSVGFSGTGFNFTQAITFDDTLGQLRMLNTSGTQTYSGLISGGGSVQINGVGGTVVLSGGNTFSGGVDIAAGTLRLGTGGGGTNTPLGTTASGTTVRAGAALDLGGFSLGTAEDLTLNGSGVSGTGALINNGAAATYQGIVTLNTASSVGGTGNITLTAPLAGTATLTKIGTGTLTLGAASTRNGATQVDAGVLKLANSTAAGSPTKTITLNGSTLDLATNTSVASYPVVVSASSTILSDQATAGSVGLTHSLDTLNLNNGGTLSIGRGANVASGTAGVQFDVVTLGATGATFNIGSGAALEVAGISGNTRSFSVSGAGNMTVSGPITTTTGDVTMSGSGTLLLAGNSTYSGATTINSGTVRLGAAGGGTNTPLGTTTGSTVVNSGGTLDLNGFTLGSTEALSLSGNGSGAGAFINSSTTAATWKGTVTLAAATTIGGTGNLILSGTVSGGGNPLTKTGTNTLTFSGATANLGATQINAGAVSVTSGATLNTGALSSSAPSTTLLIASGGSVVANYASGTTTFAGTISGGGTLQKTGAGTLQFTNNFNAGSNSTLVLSGGTLSLLGAQVTFGTIHITGNTVLDFSGSATTFLSSASLIIDVGVTVTVNNWVSIANNPSASTVWYATNTINGVPLATVNQSGGALNQITFTNFTGMTTTWVAPPGTNGWFSHEIRPTPEPATYGMIFLGAAASLVLLRKTRKKGGARYP